MEGYLLGDSGYPCTNVLLNGFPNPRLPHEIKYNKAHCKTRVRIEMLFGQFRNRYVATCHLIDVDLLQHTLFLTLI